VLSLFSLEAEDKLVSFRKGRGKKKSFFVKKKETDF
jgi:hypothetical protein